MKLSIDVCLGECLLSLIGNLMCLNSIRCYDCLRLSNSLCLTVLIMNRFIMG